MQITAIDQKLGQATVDLFCTMDGGRPATSAPIGTYTVDLTRATFLYFTNHADPARGHLQDISLKDWIQFVEKQSIWQLQRGLEFVDVHTPSNGDCANEVTARWAATR